METARNNVTDISRFTRERRGAARTPLDECRETSVLGLKGALDEALEQIKLQLLEMTEKAAGADMYALYKETLELAHGQRGEICEAFGRHYLSRFNLEARRGAGRARKGAEVPELSLLEPDDLEASLATSTLVNAINNGCAEELFALDKRVGMLVNDPDLVHGGNPLGPEVISDSLMAALEEQDVSMKARLLMVTQLTRRLPDHVKETYRDINQQLVKRNVLPTIRVGLRRSGSAASGQEAGKPAQPQESDLLTVLQRLMGAGGAPTAPAAGPFAAGAVQAGVNAAVLQSLNMLQHGKVEETAPAGVDVSALVNALSQGGGRVNVLHDLRDSGVAGPMNAMDTMTLDIVAMVFDYILDDKRIPDAIKALIGRLQIPVLKVAMLDKTFFSHKSHPARKLLDTLAEAAIGWDADEGHGGALYRAIEQLVNDILERFDDKVDVFAQALAQLSAFLAAERKEAAAALVPSIQAIRNRELAEVSLRIAHDEVHSALLGHPVPAPIVEFLSAHWQRMLADIHHKAGEESAAWTGALATMNDLIWSVAPKTDSEARKRLVGMLPSLLKRLNEGVRYMDLDQADRDAFFGQLVKCHAAAVKSGQVEESSETPPTVDELAGFGDVPLLDQVTEFEPVVATELPEGEAPALMEELAECAEDALADAGAPTDAQWQQGGLEPELASLRRGSWIEYLEQDGTAVRAKLSWISPMRGMYLFTNRYGQRAISISAEGLTAKLANGEARILDDVPLMDRAVDNLMERLQQHAA